MFSRSDTLDLRLLALDRDTAALRPGLPVDSAAAIDRWRQDVAALRFHLRPRSTRPPLLAILGGTGTGKSTLVNRLLDTAVSATSFRRTYTAGAVAIVGDEKNLPDGWLAIQHHLATADELPARGQIDSLIVVATKQPLAEKVTIIDTPDLDGDTPEHHAQADRVFRWIDAVLFVVTPEKYQMTELLPYYRRLQRYGIPAMFVMNKCEEAAVLDDYTRQLAERGFEDARVFAIPRDDAAYEPPADSNLPALRAAIEAIQLPAEEQRQQGLAVRTTDLLGRLNDQILAPLRQARRQAEQLLQILYQMEAPEPGVDVNPLTQQLQRRLQQRSVLYLMGPGRMLERARQVPGLLMRMPRHLWDVVVRGKKVDVSLQQGDDSTMAGQLPDFASALTDQFTIVQSRIDDALRSSPTAERWLNDPSSGYKAAKLDPQDAGKIAEEEMGELKAWLEKRWNATPRDTLLLMKLLRHLPGGKQLVQWTEGTPYLLALIVATHYSLFGHVDLMVVGGFSLATWLTEKLSNEVTGHVRATNRRIADRFTAMAHEQIERVCQWLQTQSPVPAKLDAIEQIAGEIQEMIGGGK